MKASREDILVWILGLVLVMPVVLLVLIFCRSLGVL